MVGFWATLSLNIPDFSRYAKSQRDQIIGQTLGLPLTMALYSFIGVAVTSATTIIYGADDLGPGGRADAFQNPVVLVVAMLALCIATLATNIAANVVQPGERFCPPGARGSISFRMGGFITGHRWRADDAVETGGRPDRLYFHLADRLQRVARADWRES